MSASIWNPGSPLSSVASVVAFTPTATISATQVQAAIEEVDTETRTLSTALRTDLNELGVNVKASPYNAVGDGLADDTTAFTAALATGLAVIVPEGNYKVNNLTMSTNAQQMTGIGNARLIKGANGPILNVSGNDCVLKNIQARGESSTPVFTGDNISITGNGCVLDSCGSRWAYGRAVKCTGGRLRIYGSNDIYQTADTSSTGYDIEVGQSGVASAYSVIEGIQSTQATGGILFVAPGAAFLSQCQFGKLTVDPGASPAGMHGVLASLCRINGEVAISVSATALLASSCSSNVTLSGAISGVTLDIGMQSGTTLTIGGSVTNCSYNLARLEGLGVTVVDNGQASWAPRSAKSYTCSWTASTTNPTLGNGTLSAQYTKDGRSVTVEVELTIGSTTALGTGAWLFSLPFSRSNSLIATSVGIAHIFDSGATYYLGAVLVNGGASTAQIYLDNNANAVGPANPMAWATGDKLKFSITYPCQ